MIRSAAEMLYEPGTVVLAHGLGGRTDLPVDPRLAAYGAAAAVAASFVIVLFLRPRRVAGLEGRGLALPAGLSRFLCSSALTVVLRSLVLAGFVLVLAAAFLGPDGGQLNLAPYMLYVIFWVGIIPASLAFGAIWVQLNPLRMLHTGLSRLVGVDPDKGLEKAPAWLGMWPAAGWLLLFVWLELVFPARGQPAVVGLFLVAYALVTINLAFVFGRGWFAQGDGFEVYSRLLGALSPFAQRGDGRVALRPPLTGLSTVPAVPGLTAVVAVLIGSTGFDGLTRTAFWRDEVPADSVLLGTAGLLALIVIVGGLFVLAISAGGALAAKLAAGSDAGPGTTAGTTAGTNGDAGPGTNVGPGPRYDTAAASWLPGAFAHSLVPIALGYAVAHYFSFFLFEGQVPLALLSDPFGQGWDLFGTADWRLNYLLVSTYTIAGVQIAAIVLGHVAGVIAAHDRAVEVFDAEGTMPARARRSEYPLGVLMVGITLCGVLLLVSA